MFFIKFSSMLVEVKSAVSQLLFDDVYVDYPFGVWKYS